MLHTCTLPGPGAILQIMMLFVPPLLGHDGDQLLFIMATAMTICFVQISDCIKWILQDTFQNPSSLQASLLFSQLCRK